MPLTAAPWTAARLSKARKLGATALFVAAFGLARPAAAGEPTKDECVDANEAAQTLAQSNQLREAKRKLLVCVAAGCPGPVREDCLQLLTQVELKIPTLVFEVKDEHDRDLSDVRVKMDGQPLVDKLDGTAVPLDPGQHVFVLHAEGYGDTESTLLVHEGDKNRHERLVLIAATPPAASAVAVGKGAQGSSQSLSRSASDKTVQRTTAFAFGGAGAAGLIVGAILGFMAKATYDHAHDTECGPSAGTDDPNACTPPGYRDGQTAHGLATASTFAIVGGLAFLGAGAFLYGSATSGSRVSAGPVLTAGRGGIGVQGRW
jgi:hypothetical protein